MPARGMGQRGPPLRAVGGPLSAAVAPAAGMRAAGARVAQLQLCSRRSRAHACGVARKRWLRPSLGLLRSSCGAGRTPGRCVVVRPVELASLALLCVFVFSNQRLFSG